jgi:hypothetical protein
MMDCHPRHAALRAAYDTEAKALGSARGMSKEAIA